MSKKMKRNRSGSKTKTETKMEGNGRLSLYIGPMTSGKTSRLLAD